ncbi:hypothetical protein LNP00_06350 [Fructobacillus sp. M158]|uniref:hypothetical protein n=1 Tax=Fructobacillus parabroussonetiae TaxID=2713174 RepID=UPI00200B5654|nr:hypothetical protein [Fructobacillus parabroussonetiae]MCK8617973.1 hypothetical protein [Fructobacillus parabroussonetiae]
MNKTGIIQVKTVFQNGSNQELSFNSKNAKKDFDDLVTRLKQSGIDGFIAFKNMVIVNRNIVYIAYFDRKTLKDMKKNEELLDGGNDKD